jgi:hypothetical protein
MLAAAFEVKKWEDTWRDNRVYACKRWGEGGWCKTREMEREGKGMVIDLLVLSWSR